MEFKLNKIDTDIRLKMQEKIKENKVHSGKSINTKRDLKDHKKNYYTKDKKSDSKEKQYITIDGVKDFEQKLCIKVEKEENTNDENSKGMVLDVKK